MRGRLTEEMTFQARLEQVAKDVVEDRLETWMKYTFEKEMLPELIAEATERVRVEVMTNANIPEEIVVRVRFAPKQKEFT